MNLPKNLEDTFTILKKDLKPQEQIEILNMTKDELYRMHTNLGRSIRNNWKLWHKSELAEYFNKLGIYHADDMSGIIIESFWHHLRNEPLDLDNQVKYYQDFWKNQGINESQ
jgi:hypothetical protein